MTLQAIVIDPASIFALNEQRAGRSGRPRKGVSVDDAGKRKAFSLSTLAQQAVTNAAKAMGVSESVLVEAFARSLVQQFLKNTDARPVVNHRDSDEFDPPHHTASTSADSGRAAS